MSRSFKQPIVKDRPRNHKKSSAYWRRIRRVQGNEVHKLPRNIDVTYLIVDDALEEQLSIDVTQPKSIINDYDYSDYKFRDCGIKYTRK